MVVDDLDIGRSLIGPHKADAPLVVDADRVLPDAVRSVDQTMVWLKSMAIGMPRRAA
jgi:hypothetical protein